VAQAIIIQINKAEDAARFHDSGNVFDHGKAVGKKILEDEPDPDEVEHSQIIQREQHVTLKELDVFRAYRLPAWAILFSDTSTPAIEPPG